MGEQIVENTVSIKLLSVAFSATLLMVLVGHHICPQKLQYPVDQDGVISMKTDMVQSFFKEHEINNYPHVYIYHRDNCPHCVEFMPKFREIATNFRQKYGNQVTFTEINTTKVWKAYGEPTEFVPTLRLQLGNREITFNGQKDINIVSQWILEFYEYKLTPIQ